MDPNPFWAVILLAGPLAVAAMTDAPDGPAKAVGEAPPAGELVLARPGSALARPLILRFSNMREADRRSMFWVADRDVAEVRSKIHAANGQGTGPP